jgi:hypothetical protein
LETGQFHESAAECFAEWNYASPQYKMRFVRLPLGRPGAVYAMQEVKRHEQSRNNAKTLASSFWSKVVQKEILKSPFRLLLLVCSCLLPHFRSRSPRDPEVDQTYASPTSSDIYNFISTLFNQARLSSECSIVCLIYVERLMEKGNVPLLPETWRPVLLCGLLLSHKVWQDHACWNIEVAQVYPQFSLAAINRLEKRFLERIKVTCATGFVAMHIFHP